MRVILFFCLVFTLSCNQQDDSCLEATLAEFGLVNGDTSLDFVIYYDEYSCDKCSISIWSKLEASTKSNYRLLVKARGKSTKEKIIPMYLHDHLDKVLFLSDNQVPNCLSSLGLEDEAVVVQFDPRGRLIAKKIN